MKEKLERATYEMGYRLQLHKTHRSKDAKKEAKDNIDKDLNV